MATRRKPAKTRNPKRKRGSRPTNVTTRAQRIATLRYARGDAHESLMNAVAMGNWAAVVKYAKQVQGFEQKLFAIEESPLAKRRFSPMTSFGRTAGQKYGRGRLP